MNAQILPVLLSSLRNMSAQPIGIDGGDILEVLILIVLNAVGPVIVSGLTGILVAKQTGNLKAIFISTVTGIIPFQFDCAMSLSIRLRTVIPHESGNPSSLAPQNMVTSQWIGISIGIFIAFAWWMLILEGNYHDNFPWWDPLYSWSGILYIIVVWVWPNPAGILVTALAVRKIIFPFHKIKG